MMAAYFALRILKGKLSYSKVMSVEKFKEYKDEIDEILIAEGKEDLIEELPEV